MGKTQDNMEVTVMEIRRRLREQDYNDNYMGEDDFYTDHEIETLLEDDEISASEEAFMRGYMNA